MSKPTLEEQLAEHEARLQWLAMGNDFNRACAIAIRGSDGIGWTVFDQYEDLTTLGEGATFLEAVDAARRAHPSFPLANRLA